VSSSVDTKKSADTDDQHRRDLEIGGTVACQVCEYGKSIAQIDRHALQKFRNLAKLVVAALRLFDQHERDVFLQRRRELRRARRGRTFGRFVSRNGDLADVRGDCACNERLSVDWAEEPRGSSAPGKVSLRPGRKAREEG
jgi:hypothetical protein